MMEEKATENLLRTSLFRYLVQQILIYVTSLIFSPDNISSALSLPEALFLQKDYQETPETDFFPVLRTLP